MLHKQDIAGTILAGGKSSRMGRDKAELKFQGKSLLQYMKQILMGAGLEDIYISRANEIADDIQNCGPLGGIDAILKHVGHFHKHIIFVPIDMPALKPALIKRLINAPADVSLVKFEKFCMPFRLSTDKYISNTIKEILQKKENISVKSMQEKIPQSHHLSITSAEQHCFQNINTANEWNSYIERNNV